MKAKRQKNFFQRISFEIEELVLIALILLNIFDAIELLPPTLDYIKKIISWTALGVLLYKADIIKLFTGIKRPKLDTVLIIAYFLLIIKNLVAYASGSTTKNAFLQPFYTFLVNHSGLIERTGLLIGTGLLVFVAVHLTLRAKIKKPSMLSILGEKETSVKSFKQASIRLTKVLFVIFMFFIVIFNLMMEWLAIAIDAPLLMIGLAFYVFFIVRHKNKFHPESFLAKFGEFGNTFYQDVIEHFKYKKTIFRALSGLLVLHLLTDALNFLWPFLFGINDPLYFNLLVTPHFSMYALLQSDFVQIGLLKGLSVIPLYLGNVFGLVMLLLLPGIVWTVLYKNKPFNIRKGFLGILASSFIIMLLAPVFRIQPLFNQSLYGVDIIGKSAWQAALLDPLAIITISFIVGLGVFIFAQQKKRERKLIHLGIVIMQLFFTVYTILFFASIAIYYVNTIGYLFMVNKLLLGILFIIFFICSIIFYVFALISFLLDTHRHGQEKLR
ncbi:hypothetical protein K9M74_04910 [Candidatus Woesearchaeota archaeon]|nr:hypothetical protein [Candidatus Woesearchaeota archaeon]